jgi:hypothetical protein
VDLLKLAENSIGTVDAWDLLNKNKDVNPDMIATLDREAERQIKERGMRGVRAWVLTFKKLLSETDFVPTMQKMLKTLEKHYEYPVDVEFTTNFTQDGQMKINLVQCRPLQTKGITTNVVMPETIEPDKILFESYGHTMGGSISTPLKQVIYVEPEAYQNAPPDQKYGVARLIGKLNRQIEDKETTPTIILGPGRWGTTTPSLGVPVSFAEINKITVMAEIAYEGGNLMPDLSFGTHFFQDLVETEIFYVAIFPGKEKVTFNRERFREMPNRLGELLPDSAKYEHIVKVYKTDGQNLQMICDMISQRVVCFFS